MEGTVPGAGLPSAPERQEQDRVPGAAISRTLSLDKPWDRHPSEHSGACRRQEEAASYLSCFGFNGDWKAELAATVNSGARCLICGTKRALRVVGMHKNAAAPALLGSRRRNWHTADKVSLSLHLPLVHTAPAPASQTTQYKVD